MLADPEVEGTYVGTAIIQDSRILVCNVKDELEDLRDPWEPVNMDLGPIVTSNTFYS
jgi:hypothetical protein